MLVGAAGGDSPRGRAVEEPDLEEVRLVDVLDGVGLFADRGGEGAHADRTAAELVDDGEQELAVDLVEAVGVDLEQGEGVVGDGRGDGAVGADLGEVAHAPEKAVGDAGGAAAPAGDLASALPSRGTFRIRADRVTMNSRSAAV